MINKNLIFVDDQSISREQIIMKIVDKSFEEGLITDKDMFYKAIFERENMEPTNIGFSIAIPHGKSDSVKMPFVSFVRTEGSIKWNNDSIKFVFLMGLPETGSEKAHLRFLSSISRKLVNEDFRKLLNEVKTQEEIFKILNDIDSKEV